VKGSHWDSLSWSELEAECYVFAASCLAAGLEPKQTLVIMGFNSPHWMLAFYGTAMAGGVLAGSYSTNNTETCEYLARDCAAKLVLAESWKHGGKFEAVLKAPEDTLSSIIIWGEDTPPAGTGGVTSFVEFMAAGKASVGGIDKVRAVEATLDASECVGLIYTSGTTGMPKGVMLSHDNLTWDARAGIYFATDVSKDSDNPLVMGPESVFLSYLPLSHIAAQCLDFMFLTATGGEIFFATPDALAGGLVPLLQSVRPTFFFGVPRVWEKVMDGIKAKAADNSPAKTFLAKCAKDHGLEYNNALADSAGKSSGTFGIMKGIWGALVYKKVREAIGLDRCNLLGSGAAPISREVLNFFWSLDVPIVEGFGMSETTGIMTLQQFPCLVRLGSVGAPISPTAIKLDTSKGTKPGEGEICMRARNIMMGYLNKPDKTAETFDEERYLRSGDLGSLTPSPDGSRELLSITGRIKELIITAGGENVPPVLIEDAIKANIAIVSNCVLIGDRRKYLSMLVTLRVEVDPTTLVPSEQLNPNGLIAAKALGSTATTLAEAKADPKVLAAIQEGVDKYNKTQASSRAQNIQKFYILDAEFSVPGGELTGSQKLKKNVVYEKFSKEIESMYEGA